jgi:hypothetical protein
MPEQQPLKVTGRPAQHVRRLPTLSRLVVHAWFSVRQTAT